MNHTRIASQSQAHIHVQSKIDDFFGRFKIATLMHGCGLRKHHGHSVRSLTEAIFTLPFVGKNFFRGIVLNSELPFGKDAAYQLLKGESYNWRRLLLALGRRLFGVFNRLTSDERILGSNRFVEKTLARANEDYDRRMRLKASGIDLDVAMNVVSAHHGVYTAELSAPSRRQQICQACP